MKKIICFALAAAMLFLAGCSAIKPLEDAPSKYRDYKEIPGVTQDEISALETLRNEKPRLVYGFCVSTEAFLYDDGSVGGFTQLLCDRLSCLLGFEFEFYPCSREELNEKIVSKEIDLAGDFTATPEHTQKFMMTDAIAQRMLKVFTNANADSLEVTAQTRPVRCAFMNGSTTYSHVADSWDIPFRPVFIDDQSMVPNMLANGAIDAFIEEGTLEAAFDSHAFIKTGEYYPLIYSRVSLASGNPEMASVIDVIQKYLQNGGYYELTELYNQGYKDYLRYKLSKYLTREEKEYIQRHQAEGTPILAACEVDNYPTSFYNEKEKKFQGMALDTLDQISDLTGLTFQVGNGPDVLWPELVERLESGEYSVVSELIRSNQREGRFLWANQPYCTNRYAMVSNAEYPDVNINQIYFSRVGLMEGAAHTEVFLEWFPDSGNTTMYKSNYEASAALVKGEIDLLMASENMLLNLTNYQERPGFKANIVFGYSSDSYFGFNKDEKILCSIVNKAMRYANTEEISARWKRKLFDYQSKMLKDTFPYLLIFLVALSTGLSAVCFLLMKNRKISKNLELLVRKRTNELAIQTSTLETMFESIPDLVFCKDLNSRFTKVNRSFEKYFGCLEKDIIGKSNFDGLPITEDLTGYFCEMDKDVIRDHNTFATEEYIPSIDGTSRLFETMRTTLMQDDIPIGIMGISRDITRRKAAEEAAQIASRAKSDFLSRMSHEIRTPLNAIIGMIGIAKNTEDHARIMHCLDMADNASKHLLGLINDILDMSKIEADKFELDSQEFNFEKMLMNITNVINFRAEEKKQNFIVNLDVDVPAFIIGDELRLSQVITNLLTNAVKFTPENGTVIMNIDKTEDLDSEVILKVAVEDNGIGISQEQQERLFTSFEQADGSISRKFGGTGLGLAISKRIVELMGGKVWIESELGQGSKFIFTVRAGKGKAKTDTNLSKKINKGKLRILAVDNSPETRGFFAHVMMSLGLPCDVAASGAEALDKIHNCGDKPYNIFFIDWQMPEMNGIELTKKIKETTPDSSVIFVIPVDDWGNIETEALAVGVKSFISKPLFPSAIINAINGCIEIERIKFADNERPRPDTSRRTLDGHAVLIAEDIEVNREIMSAILEDTGLSIDYAENGLIAVEMFRDYPDKYSLILMDIQMPEMDGYEATRRIRTLGLNRSEDIPIIAMTANVFREDIDNCMAAGMNDHIGKPVDSDGLFDKLCKYLS